MPCITVLCFDEIFIYIDIEAIKIRVEKFHSLFVSSVPTCEMSSFPRVTEIVIWWDPSLTLTMKTNPRLKPFEPLG